MKKGVTIALLLLAVLNGMGQSNLTIFGTSENAAGKRIELRCYDDMLSRAEVLLDEAVVDSTGAFRLESYLKYPRLVFLQVENYSQSFYAEPGRRYEVYLPEFDWAQDETLNVFLDQTALPVEFLNLPEDELNLKIKRFDELVDSFIDSNRVHFDYKFHPDRRWFDSLELLVKRECGLGAAAVEGPDFFRRYCEYTLAEMRMAMFPASRRKLIGRYIKDQTVLYHDEGYMRLLLALYEGSVSMGTRRLPLARLTAWVASADLDRYIDSLGVEPLLRDEQVRELAALQALKESYYDPRYDRAGVRRMVTLISQRSKFAEHRRIAERLLEGFNRMEGEQEVPSFVLPDAEHGLVSLDSLRGKWVYLSFVRVGDPNSLRELETLAHYRDSVYANYPDVEFVSISCDREFQKMYHFLNNSRRGAKCRWLWLHFDGNYRLLEHYEVVSYPTFVLIDPEGRLRYNVTPAPGTGFLMHAPWMKEAEKEADSWGEGLNNWRKNE